MTQQLGTPLDYVVIVAYFIAILLFGSYFGRFTKSTKDFFFGGQRFSWWLIAASCVATVVGSYSFIKYSAAGFNNGLSSSMGYLNDWIILPFFILGWLPVFYFSRSVSIPEYFEKRFDRKTRIMAIVIILLYLIGYVGINLLTLGVAMQKILGAPLMPTVICIAIISGIYLHFGGQTAVIFTDLLQAFILVIAGFILLFLGLTYIGGVGEFWGALSLEHKWPFAPFNQNPSFSFVGIFWQDAIANTTAFYFMNQGILMRFLSLKSVKEGRKAMTCVVVLLMPIALIAIANAGWLGRSMVNLGLLPSETQASDIFVTVANVVCVPGVFGFIMAALTAALMSTVDTLINAFSAVVVNDIYRPFVKRDADDRHYLKVAQWVAALAAVIGVLLVPLFNSYKSIFVAHATFTAAITPPLVVTIILGAFWKRFTPNAAFATLLAGSFMVLISFRFPELVSPFGHGVPAVGNFKYMRALYALVTCSSIGIIISLITKPKENTDGLTVGSIKQGMKLFKGGEINLDSAKPIRAILKNSNDDNSITLTKEQMSKLKAKVGDLIYIRDKRWWYGGLKSAQSKLGPPHNHNGQVLVPDELITKGHLAVGEDVVVEKIF